MSLSKVFAKDLPSGVNGKYRDGVSLSATSWFGVGGVADVLFKPENKDDLAYFLCNVDKSIPIRVIGAMSNTLIRDGGIRGVIIKLGSAFTSYSFDGKNDEVEFGSAMLDSNIQQIITTNCASGIEFLTGIPGSIGGNIAMNAGCFGGEVKDFLISCSGFDLLGNYKTLTNHNLSFSYRSSSIKDNFIITSAKFSYVKSSVDVIKAKLDDIRQKRESSQPTKQKTCGSTFKNPLGFSAWRLLSECGMQKVKIGGAFFSEKHANFLINDGTATAKDIESLIDLAIQTVKQKTGIDLTPEIKIIGESL